jgi:hypothetical protein
MILCQEEKDFIKENLNIFEYVDELSGSLMKFVNEAAMAILLMKQQWQLIN